MSTRYSLALPPLTMPLPPPLHSMPWPSRLTMTSRRFLCTVKSFSPVAVPLLSPLICAKPAWPYQYSSSLLFRCDITPTKVDPSNAFSANVKLQLPFHPLLPMPQLHSRKPANVLPSYNVKLLPAEKSFSPPVFPTLTMHKSFDESNVRKN